MREFRLPLHAVVFALVLLPSAALHAPPATVDLTAAVVVTPHGLGSREQKGVEMLVEEVEKRSRVRWEQTTAWPAGAVPRIVVGPAEGVRQLAAAHGFELPDGLGRGGREGYRIGI